MSGMAPGEPARAAGRASNAIAAAMRRALSSGLADVRLSVSKVSPAMAHVCHGAAALSALPGPRVTPRTAVPEHASGRRR